MIRSARSRPNRSGATSHHPIQRHRRLLRRVIVPPPADSPIQPLKFDPCSSFSFASSSRCRRGGGRRRGQGNAPPRRGNSSTPPRTRPPFAQRGSSRLFCSSLSPTLINIPNSKCDSQSLYYMHEIIKLVKTETPGNVVRSNYLFIYLHFKIE